jgi:DNA polymerase-3 subunit alpha
MKYHELHLHDHYSVLDGVNTPTEYMKRANELGMTHLAQTNHGTLSGWRDFQKSAATAGIIPILGVEAYISDTDRFDRRSTNKRADGTKSFNHIGILAMNENGMRNVNAMMQEAWTGGFYSKPRIDMDLLEQHNEDIVVLSGCLGGLLASALTTENGHVPDYQRALQLATRLKFILGERFFIEIQGHNPAYINAGLLKIAEDLKIKPVVTSDCHHARKEDLWIQEAMLILSTKPDINKRFDFTKSQQMEHLERYNYLYPDRSLTFEKFGLYLHAAQDHVEALAKQGIGTEPITNTDIIAQMVGEYPLYKNLDLLPTPDASIDDLDEELRRQAFEGLKERGKADDPEYVARVEEELAIIKQMGFAVYFLILSDIVRWARAQGIFMGPGRGSGVASLVNYSLFITNIDPIPYKLLFFRFLDPDRPDWPDIDVDFEVKRRYEVKEYVNRKYGYTANIMTFTLFRGKSAIKSAASVFLIPQGEVNKVTKMLTDDPDFPALEVFATSESTAEFRRKYPEVEPLARALEGRIKSTGMHAGGTVISKVPIDQYVPMQTATDPQDEAKGRVPLIAVDMTEAAEIGLIKYDFLGLNNLTVILETIADIKKRHGVEIDPYELIDPNDLLKEDPEVLSMLSQGHTKAVFQCEGGPYTNLLLDMGGVQTFNDLVASNALVRPGASNSSIGANYIKGKLTGDYEFIHASTEPFTRDTYGQILFQEQQMQLCTTVAGMSMRDANQVRQAISKKVKEKLAVWEPAFIEGATKTLGEKKAQFLWTDLEKSAQYAFNKAHSVGYSYISYWTAWFKYHYPVEYMNAVLNNVGGTDKKVKSMFYLMETKRLGVKVMLPHVNASDVNNKVEDDGIRMGLSSIKGIASKSATKVVDAAPFSSYENLKEVSATKGSGISIGLLSALNKIGGAAFPDNPRTGNERENFYEYLNIPAFTVDLDPHIKTQFRLCEEYTQDGAFVVCGMVYNIKNGHGWTLIEYVDESGTAGTFTNTSTKIEKANMYVMLVSNNSIVQYVTVDDLVNGKAGAFGKYLEKEKLELKDGEYRCISYKERRSKAGNEMADAVFTDGDKNLYPTIIFSKLLGKAKIPCLTSAKVRAFLNETDDGSYILKEINQ